MPNLPSKKIHQEALQPCRCCRNNKKLKRLEEGVECEAGDPVLAQERGECATCIPLGLKERKRVRSRIAERMRAAKTQQAT